MLQDERRPFFPGATEESLAFTNAARRLESSGARVTVLVAVVPSLQLTATQKALDWDAGALAFTCWERGKLCLPGNGFALLHLWALNQVLRPTRAHGHPGPRGCIAACSRLPQGSCHMRASRQACKQTAAVQPFPQKAATCACQVRPATFRSSQAAHGQLLHSNTMGTADGAHLSTRLLIPSCPVGKVRQTCPWRAVRVVEAWC